MKKNLFIVLGVVLGIMLISGVTYAAYTWSYQSKISGTGNCFNVIYTKGRNIGSNENSSILMPGTDFRSGLSTTVLVKIDDKCEIANGNGILYLNTDSTTSSILLTSGVLKYQVIDGNDFVASGTVDSAGDVVIYENFDIGEFEKSLTVIVWLDGKNITEENQEGILFSTYKGSISLDVESR